MDIGRREVTQGDRARSGPMAIAAPGGESASNVHVSPRWKGPLAGCAGYGERNPPEVLPKVRWAAFPVRIDRIGRAVVRGHA